MLAPGSGTGSGSIVERMSASYSVSSSPGFRWHRNSSTSYFARSYRLDVYALSAPPRELASAAAGVSPSSPLTGVQEWPNTAGTVELTGTKLAHRARAAVARGIS